MRIGVVGGRDFTDLDFVFTKLDNFVKVGDTIVSGGANGVDSIAEKFVEKRGFIKFKCFPPLEEEDAYKKRNQRIVDDIDVLLAFPTKKSKGTWDTIAKARREGIRIVIFQEGLI